MAAIYRQGDVVGKFIKAATLSAAVIAACAGQAAADGPLRVKSLVMLCRNDQKTCEEYLLGVWDAVIMMQEMDKSAPMVCPAEGPSGRQLRIAFSLWADQADPKVLTDSPRVVGAILSYKHTFPCTAPAPAP